jgi:hypothetical protein
MSETNNVVARFSDGRLLKGRTQDFSPGRSGFHLAPSDGGPAIQVDNRELKAVFFVKNLEGNPFHSELKEFIAAPSGAAHGKKIAVVFKDGELLCGYTLSYLPDRQGFFLFPVDPDSNNIRVFILAAAAAEIKAGAAAEALARKVLAQGRG